MVLLFVRASLVVSIFAAAMSTDPAYAGCVLTPPQPLSHWYHSADTFLFVRRLESGEFEVLEVAKTHSDTPLKKGSRLKAMSLRENPAEVGIAFGFEGEALKFDGLPFTQSEFDYLRKTPDPELPQIERMKYFAAFLNSSEEGIAADALRELEDALPRELPAVAKLVGADTLRAWVRDPKARPERVGAFARLLGFVGDTGDAAWMKARILASTGKEFYLESAGLMTGYLLLSGASGLDVLDEKILGPRKAAISDLYPAMQAIEFVGDLDEKPIPRDRLVRSLHLLLERSALADLVVIRLARWKDWSVQERLTKMYNEEEFNVPAIRRNIIRYMMASTKDVPADAGAAAPHVAKGKAFIERLRATGSKELREVERVFFRKVIDE